VHIVAVICAISWPTSSGEARDVHDSFIDDLKTFGKLIRNPTCIFCCWHFGNSCWFLQNELLASVRKSHVHFRLFTAATSSGKRKSATSLRTVAD